MSACVMEVFCDCPTPQGLRNTRLRHPDRGSGGDAAVPAAPASAQGLFDFLFRPPRRRARRPPPAPMPTPFRASIRGLDRGDPEPSGIGRRRCSACGCATDATSRSSATPAPTPRSSATRSARPPRPRCSPAAASTTPSPATAPATRTCDNAFAYRERTVENCTCNGRDPYGLVTLSPTERSDAAQRRHRRDQRRLRRLQRQRPAQRRVHADRILFRPVGGVAASGWRRPGSRRATPRRCRRRRSASGGAVQDRRGRRVQLDR